MAITNPITSKIKAFRKRSFLKGLNNRAGKKVLKVFEKNYDKQVFQGDNGRRKRWAKRKEPDTDPILRDTGRMRKSFQFRSSAKGFEIKNTAPYAHYHQEGTDDMVARPIIYHSKTIDKIIEKEIFDSLDDLFGVK